MKRELGSYFESPIAYVFIIIFLALMGFFTFMVDSFFDYGQADLRPFFRWHPWLFLVLVPAIGMRLWAEERRSGSMELLLTLPISAWHAITGKFLAAWVFIILALALTFPTVLTVVFLGDPDLGVVFTGYLGSAMLAGVYLAVSAMTSAMTRSQVVSFILSVVVCLLLVLAGWPMVTGMFESWAPAALVDLVASFSVLTHYESMQRGVIDTRDLVYGVSVIVFFLFTTAVILRNRRSL
jgi:ABC-2 type transport system permease protein